MRTLLIPPRHPASITTTGMAAGAPQPYPHATHTLVEKAQLAGADPANAAYAGNVKTTDTRPFWRDAAVSPSNLGWRWNHNGESQYLNGKAMGEQTVDCYHLEMVRGLQHHGASRF